ncbi:MAG: response regulator, partial [Chloroflexi bacterium]
MSELWHILLVEDDDYLNQSIVNSLRKDGYIVQGVKSGAEAIRLVWSEEYDVVIGDLRTPGADGFEMLQWLRSFRPKTRMIMVAASASAADRTQALEAGVVSYLSKPLDLHQLKEELRRLLQQTGFSASLDSFDLLD